MKIIRNQVSCRHCGRSIRSHAYNGYIECDCGKAAISGGLRELIRYGAEEDYKEESIIETDFEYRKKV